MTKLDDGRELEGKNPDLVLMHRQLLALVSQLERSIDRAPTAVAIGEITDQIVEINARATAAGRLLLMAQSDEIARHAQRVSSMIPDVEREIENIERFEHIFTTVTSVLDAADRAIEAATLLGR